jgi:hypothetical protein
MGRGGRLKAALDAEKGVDYKLQRQKKLRKAARKQAHETSAVEKEDTGNGALEDDSDNEDGGVSLGLVWISP